MKKKWLLTLMLITVSIFCHAQYYSTQTINVPVQTPAGTIHTQMSYFYKDNKDYSLLFKNKTTKIKSYYDIGLQGDSLIRSYTRIDIKSVPHSIPFKVGKLSGRLTPNETQFIVRIGDYDETYVGLPADSCWMFKMITGKINVYHFLPFREWEFAIAIQKGEAGPIEKISPELIESLISDNKKAMRLFNEGNYLEAILAYNETKPHPLDFLEDK